MRISAFPRTGRTVVAADGPFLHAPPVELACKRKINIHAIDLGYCDDALAFVHNIITTESVQVLQEWNDVLAEYRNVLSIYEQHGDEIRPGSPLPRDYEDVVACCELMTNSVLQSRIQKLSTAMNQSRLSGQLQAHKRTQSHQLHFSDQNIYQQH